MFDAILEWCQPFEPPSSPLGEAIRDFINPHEALGRFLENGAIPLDDTLVERQHIRVALTRKAYLFVGSDLGGDRAAVNHTLLSYCALNDVDPEAHLADIQLRLARGDVTKAMARELLPHRWKVARAGRPSPA